MRKKNRLFALPLLSFLVLTQVLVAQTQEEEIIIKYINQRYVEPAQRPDKNPKRGSAVQDSSVLKG